LNEALLEVWELEIDRNVAKNAIVIRVEEGEWIRVRGLRPVVMKRVNEGEVWAIAMASENIRVIGSLQERKLQCESKNQKNNLRGRGLTIV
jgi:hypothetical protein